MTDGTQFVVIGAGGLGCPALLGLRAAGATDVVVIDHDRVEAHNLARQVLFDPGDVGAHKATCAAARLRASGIAARGQIEQVRPEQLDRTLGNFGTNTIILECSDRPELKFALNDFCLGHGLPLVIGAALGFSAHVLGIAHPTACYRCIFETPPPRELTPSCAAAGILGPVVGSAGWLMAHLAVAWSQGKREGWGQLFALDFARTTMRTFNNTPRAGCLACQSRSPNPSITKDPHGHRSHSHSLA